MNATETKLLWPLEKLQPWDKNPRAIDKKDFERLKKQLTKHKQYKPLLVNQDGVILGGNMRYQAMKDLGMTEAWVSVVDAKTEKDMVEYALSDNDRAGYYEEDRLAELVMDVDIDFDTYLVDLGKLTNLKDLIDKFSPTEEDDFDVDEALPEEPTSQLGDVYKLGNHRLMCGDSTKLEDVEKLMDGDKADMVFTDPPYGVDFQSNMRTKTKKFDVLENDDTILTEWIQPAIQFSDGWILFCTTWKVLKQWLEVGEAIGKLSNMIIWDKGGGGIGDLEGSLLTDYEIILAYNRGNKIIGKRIGSVWSINKDGSMSYNHPTQKPVEVPATAIKSFSNGDVLDLFGGSGSTLIACEQLDRKCYMMELDPRYVDVIIKRWEKFTGKKAEKL